MLKVFLIEDEFIVREGIKNNIDWAGEGFIFSGEAADGELAYPLIKSEQPDIIITDIRMPFMDGLELSRLVKKELPQTKIIILSGHEEFSYAQEAIKIGVTEYLLKPINSAELIKAVKCVREQIISEREEKENFERCKREIEKNETDNKQRLFNEMLTSSLSTDAMLEKGRRSGLELSAKYYQIVLFKYNIEEEENCSSELSAVRKEIRGIDTRSNSVMLFDRAIEGMALLIKGDSPAQLQALCDGYIGDLKKVISHYPAARYFGGIGQPVERLADLSYSFESAARAFSLRFILDKSAMISYNEISAQKIHEVSVQQLIRSNLRDQI